MGVEVRVQLSEAEIGLLKKAFTKTTTFSADELPLSYLVRESALKWARDISGSEGEETAPERRETGPKRRVIPPPPAP